MGLLPYAQPCAPDGRAEGEGRPGEGDRGDAQALHEDGELQGGVEGLPLAGAVLVVSDGKEIRRGLRQVHRAEPGEGQAGEEAGAVAVEQRRRAPKRREGQARQIVQAPA